MTTALSMSLILGFMSLMTGISLIKLSGLILFLFLLVVFGAMVVLCDT